MSKRFVAPNAGSPNRTDRHPHALLKVISAFCGAQVEMSKDLKLQSIGFRV